ncbi:MAG: GNAT family N-acetyltransferase [Bdellovibrionota bacterium]
MTNITLTSPHLEKRNYKLKGSVVLRNGEEKFSVSNYLDTLQLVEAHFALFPDKKSITVGEKEYTREEFFQMPDLWHHRGKYEITPEKWIKTRGEPHPTRPSVPETTLYSRYSPQIGKTVSLRKLTLKDLPVFHKWHNSPRVSHFWELNKPEEELTKYIEEGSKDPHHILTLLEADGEPVGYFEIYWVKENRLGAYYDCEPFDRGFHFLIGNSAFLGAVNTDAFVKSVLHFIYLDEARTRRVMAEPRSDNAKVLKYAEATIGWKKLKEFNFPHKRSALLENSREVFFQGLPL